MQDERPPRAPLKRGTACLNCRQRRVRCSGQKPQCSQCRDYELGCEYNETRPTTKVKALEEKVAKLSNMLRSYQMGNVTPGSASTSQVVHSVIPNSVVGSQHAHQTTPSTASNGAAFNPYGATTDLDSEMSSFLDLIGGTSAIDQEGKNGAQTQMEDSEFFSFLEAFAKADVEHQPALPLSSAPQPAAAYPHPTLPNPDSINPFARTSLPFNSVASPGPSSAQRTDLKIAPLNSMSDTFASPSASQSSQSGFNTPVRPSPDGSVASTIPQDPSVDMQTEGWLDPENISPTLRSHLIDIFFMSTKMFPKAFHIPRFINRVNLPAPKSPHPCLLYTMYTFASSRTKCPTIRGAEQRFLQIALVQLQRSITENDRLLDAIRSATMLGIYKQMQGDFMAGWLMNGQAARLALSCRLHQISSRVYSKPSKGPQNNMGSIVFQPNSFPDPENPVELGERIWTFWCTYITDRCSAILSQSPPVMADDIITTPFPRPISDFELRLVSDSNDSSIASLWSPPNHGTYGASPRPFDHSLLIDLGIKALAVLARVTQLTESDKVVQATGSQNVNSMNSTFHSSSLTTSARLRLALLDMNSQLPIPLQVDWEAVQLTDLYLLDKETSLQPDFMSLFFVIGTSWLLLHDYVAPENPAGKRRIASRLVSGMQAASKDSDVMDNVDSFSFVLWTFTARYFIGEAHARTQPMPLTDQRGSLEDETEACLQAIKQRGAALPHMASQVGELEAMWSAARSVTDGRSSD